MTEAQLSNIDGTNEALDRSDRIVRGNIVLNPGRKQARLMPALAGLECPIRHDQNRTSTPQKAEFLPSLVGQIRTIRAAYRAMSERRTTMPAMQIRRCKISSRVGERM